LNQMTRRKDPTKNKIYKSLWLSGFCLVLALGCLLFAGPEPARAANATLYLAPYNGTFVIGDTFSVGVKVNTDGASINAAEGTITFDNSLLEVVNVSSGGSDFSLWTTKPTFSNSNGTVSFGGGLPPPGYQGGGGHICTITFKSKKSGKATARFTSGAVLANDGKGTNILASMGSATYTVSPQVTTPADKEPSESRPSPEPSREREPEPEPEPEYNKPEVKSGTHPDPDKWYNQRQVRFSWELPEDVTGVSIRFDQDPSSDPGPKSDGKFNQKEFTAETDGAWYLHLKFKDPQRWGTILHRKVLIDTDPPQPFDVNVRPAEPGDWPNLNFKTQDKLSGLDKYQLHIGSLEKQAHELPADKTEFKPDHLSAGDHTVLVRALDKAGNERTASAEFTIKPIKAPVISDHPQEIKSDDNFYLSGQAVPDSEVTVYISQGDELVATSTVTSDPTKGSWFYIHKKSLANGRYVSWAKARNANGIESLASEKVTFLVSPPVFTKIGSFVINYFTVFVSLLFLIVLIIVGVFFLANMIRKRLRREAVEVEDVLHRNLEEYKQDFDQEFKRLAQYEGTEDYKNEKAKSKSKLKKKIDTLEKKILKEVKDIEDILK